MTNTWKLVPLAVTLALASFVVFSVPTARHAEADVVSLGISAAAFSSGGNVTITVIFDEDDVASGGDLKVRVVAVGATNPTITIVDCTVDTDGDTDFADETVGNCLGSPADTDGDAGEFELTAVAVAALDGNSSNHRVRLRVSLTATCGSDSPTITVQASQDGDTDTSFVVCAGSATPTATGTPTTATPTATLTPIATGTPFPVTQITVSAAPSTVSCNGSAFITAVLRNAFGQSVPGTLVTLTANLGTISPSSAVDQGGGVLAVYTAPATQGGVATITVSTGFVIGTAQVTVSCAQATATPLPTSTPVPAPPPAIVPPSTGDAGLLARPPAWRLTLGSALVALSLLGGLALAHRRA